MEKIRFASTEEALQHLADMTGRRIKIAWEDESKSLLEDVAKEVSKNPALLLKLNKAGGINVKDHLPPDLQDAKILPTSAGNIKVVQDVEADVINKIADALKNIGDREGRAKVLDFVNENKKEFPDFHTKHKKGLDKDPKGPYYRSKAGLWQKTKELATGEGGGSTDKADKAKSKEEAKARDEARKDKEVADEKAAAEQAKKDKNFKAIQKLTIAEIKSLPNSRAKNLLEELVKDPELKELRSDFLEGFQEDIKNEKIDKETADKYVDTMTYFSNKLDKYAKESDFKSFAKSIADAVDKIEAKVDKIVETTPEKTIEEAPMAWDQWAQTGFASDLSQEVDNVVDTWLKTKE